MNFSAIHERVLATLLRGAPKGTYSSLVGRLARRELPVSWRAGLYRAFAKRVGADLDEVEKPLTDYASLDAFFTRKLRPGCRKMPEQANTLASPCDGTVACFGSIEDGTLIQAKGHEYQVSDFLADEDAPRTFGGGTFLTIYLSPKDYHRVHYVADGEVTGFHHIPGQLFPVNAFAVRNVSGLFAKNERLITYIETTVGPMASVMVAATGVGNISTTYDAVQTRLPGQGRPGARVRLSRPAVVERGSEMATFHLGSTVVLLFPKQVQLADLVAGESIKLGHPIGHLDSAKAVAAA